jgi:cell volume regulation protein A
MTDGELILTAGALLAIAIAAVLLAERLRVPGLLLFLGLGMLVGSDVLGWIYFDNAELARTIGVAAVALILFEGGLVSGWRQLRPVLAPSLSLAFLGTLITAAVAGLAAAWIFDLTLEEGLLVGAVVSATDGAAVFSLLRTSTLERRLALTLEGESGFNDAVAFILVIGLIDLIQKPGYSVLDLVGLMVSETLIGAGVGIGVGALAVAAMQRIDFAAPGLYPVLTITAGALAFGGADVLHGSGFLAIYLAGLMLGSGSIPARRTVTSFHQGLAELGQIAVFFTLGLLVFPSELGDVAFKGLLLAFVLMLVARPLAAVLAANGAGFGFAQRLLLGWAGLRGAVPIVLATYPVTEGLPAGNLFFNVAFFVVVTSTLVQGATFEPLARALGLTTPSPALPPPIADVGSIRGLGAEVVEFRVRSGDALEGRRVSEMGLPRTALVNLIVRGDQTIPPRGSTVLQGGDRLHILIRREARREVQGLFASWRGAPGEPIRSRRPSPPKSA